MWVAIVKEDGTEVKLGVTARSDSAIKMQYYVREMGYGRFIGWHIIVTTMGEIRIKRIYEAPSGDDGYRMLVDRVWPRGVSKKAAEIDDWNKDVAPSEKLRKWFGHDPSKFSQFADHYRKELAGKPAILSGILQAAGKKNLTLLYGTKDREHNQAVVLRDVLRETES